MVHRISRGILEDRIFVGKKSFGGLWFKGMESYSCTGFLPFLHVSQEKKKEVRPLGKLPSHERRAIQQLFTRFFSIARVAHPCRNREGEKETKPSP